MRDENNTVRQKAVFALTQVVEKGDDQSAIKALSECSADADKGARLCFVELLL